METALRLNMLLADYHVVTRARQDRHSFLHWACRRPDASRNISRLYDRMLSLSKGGCAQQYLILRRTAWALNCWALLLCMENGSGGGGGGAISVPDIFAAFAEETRDRADVAGAGVAVLTLGGEQLMQVLSAERATV
eukprot:COSAG05_NODE_2702_length_2749_cov_2.678868_1_plen_136_part_10